ncbi:MAG: flagellar basal body P-ring protein FlgI [Oligoflexales bacterium]|nr:flagellar basal body P-ring protein FlgI [Oligoflexales bacterium]
MLNRWHLHLALAFCFLLFPCQVFAQTRIKDLTSIRGVRENLLIGYGIVVGLPGTGDSKAFLSTSEAAKKLLNSFGMQIPIEKISTGNMASVVLTAQLPAFARNGDKIDVRLSALGDAKSLVGGTLVLSPLRAGNSEIFAFAQGVLIGASAGVQTVAFLPQGGTVEKEFRPFLAPENKITLSLKQADFTNASRIAEAINIGFNGFYAKALDHNSVDVTVPLLYQDNLVDFISELQAIQVLTDSKAIVVLNEKTGTLVMGDKVRIRPITISHGGIAIKIKDSEAVEVSEQATAEVSGQEQAQIETKPTQTIEPAGKNAPNKMSTEVTVGELVQTLLQLGVQPKDLVSIFQAVHAAGALPAELKLL